MPWMHPRSIPLPSDPDEEVLRDVARRAGLRLRFSGVARRAGQPHIEIYVGHPASPPLASFKRSAEALRWIEDWQGRQR